MKRKYNLGHVLGAAILAVGPVASLTMLAGEAAEESRANHIQEIGAQSELELVRRTDVLSRFNSYADELGNNDNYASLDEQLNFVSSQGISTEEDFDLFGGLSYRTKEEATNLYEAGSK